MVVHYRNDRGQIVRSIEVRKTWIPSDHKGNGRHHYFVDAVTITAMDEYAPPCGVALNSYNTKKAADDFAAMMAAIYRRYNDLFNMPRSQENIKLVFDYISKDYKGTDGEGKLCAMWNSNSGTVSGPIDEMPMKDYFWYFIHAKTKEAKL